MITLTMSEKELQKHLACRLEQDGYKVIQQCVDDPTKFADIDECKTHYIFGIDIVAQKNKELWIIEVKGQSNGGVASCSTFFMAGIGQILTRMTSFSEGIRYSLAIPNTDFFAPSVRKFMWSPVLPLLNLSIILIQDDGSFVLVK
jgi:hypothetical protein